MDVSSRRCSAWASTPAQEPCALGHLTSGGTLANDEALWLARATRLYPLALRDASQATGIWVPDVPVRAGSTDLELLALGADEVLALSQRASAFCAREPRGSELFETLTAARVEELGLAAFAERHPALRRMAVVVPATAHYSWHKAMKLLGLGGANLVEVPVRQARLDGSELEPALAALRTEGRPVLAVVGVYGTTEFGTLDSIHELLEVRRRFPGFWLHVDAAWGGYLPTLFRDRKGSLLPREAVREGFHYFPSERVYRATAALAQVDSVTVDPHKLGFVPFGAGALVVRNRRVLDLVQQEAPYVFTSPPDEDERRYRKLGRYVLEGSKPGAAAAACYVNHRVLPLDHDHFGRLLARSVQTSERLVDRVPSLQQELSPWVRLAIPFEPDCNLVCLAFNPTREPLAEGRQRLRPAPLRDHRRSPRPPGAAQGVLRLVHHGSPEPSRGRGAAAGRSRAGARPRTGRRRRALPAPPHPDEPLAADLAGPRRAQLRRGVLPLPVAADPRAARARVAPSGGGDGRRIGDRCYQV